MQKENLNIGSRGIDTDNTKKTVRNGSDRVLPLGSALQLQSGPHERRLRILYCTGSGLKDSFAVLSEAEFAEFLDEQNKEITSLGVVTPG